MKNVFENDILALSFLKNLSEKKKDSSKKEISSETNSDEISDIISKKLLENISKKII